MTQTFFYTRFGIGVSDPKWWEYRLRLFQAVTFPSVERHLSHSTEWIIVIDASMQREYRAWLDRIVTDSPRSGAIKLVEVTVISEAPYRLHLAARGHKEVRIVRIDDDDAIAENFLDLIPDTTGIHTLPLGYEVSLAERVMRLARRPFLSLNTVFQGESSLVEGYSRMGHHRLVEWARPLGIPVNEITTPHKAFIYSRHKQSDSTFGAVRSAITGDPKKVTLTTHVRNLFGFNDDLFEEWRQHAMAAPTTGAEKTWDKSAELNNEASVLFRELRKVNARIRESTANLFP